MPVTQTGHAADNVATDEVLWIKCEWRPESNPLGDRPAFDAVLMVRRGQTRHLIGVETKYTEPFSATEYLTHRYLDVQKESGWIKRQKIVTLAASSSNQLWRNALLAVACESQLDFVDRASVVVLALDGDAGAAKATQALAGALTGDHEDRCRFVSLESLVATVRNGSPPGQDWADRFNARYLDLTPIAEAHI